MWNRVWLGLLGLSAIPLLAAQKADDYKITKLPGIDVGELDFTQYAGVLKIADEFILFLDKFFDIFPHLRKHDMYLAGESYAGTYIPYFASKMLELNKQKKAEYNIRGVAIGNGWISPVHQYNAYYDFSVRHNLLTDEWKTLASKQLKKCQEILVTQDVITVKECEHVLQSVLESSTHTKDGQKYCINQYDIRLKDEESPACGQSWPYELEDMTTYLRLPALKSAIHADAQALGWSECTFNVQRELGGDKSVPAYNLLPGLLQEIPVLLYSGEYDLICNTLGTEYLISNLTWNGEKGFQAAERTNWFIDDKLAGHYTEARNLTFVLIKDGSHMVPYDRPIETLDMINRFMGVGDNVVNGLPSRVGQYKAASKTSAKPTEASATVTTSTPAGDKVTNNDAESTETNSTAKEDSSASVDSLAKYRSWGVPALAIVTLLAAIFACCWYCSKKTPKESNAPFAWLRGFFGKDKRAKKLRLDDQDDTNELDELVVETPTLFAAEDDSDEEHTRHKTAQFAIADDDDDADDFDDFADWHEESTPLKKDLLLGYPDLFYFFSFYTASAPRMIGVDEILKRRFLELIKSVQPAGRWKLVVVDSLSLKILNSACKMYDILEENVTLVENIEKPRQPYPSVEAVYILTPCIESCTRLVDDFSRDDGPMYAAAHVHFINGLDNAVFTDFTRKLKATGADKYIQSLKEMYVDFLVREQSVYTLDDERKFHTLFGNDSSSGGGNRSSSASKIESHLEDMAKQVLCMCVTLGENPLIRYHRPLDVQGTINRNIPWHLAKLVQAELDNFCKINPEFPPPRDPPLPRGTVILLDRTIDPISPFLHEFTYQAMIADLLKNEETAAGLKYSYEYTQEDGTSKDQEITLNDQDTVYTSIRHMHIAGTTEKLIEEFNAFTTENKSATGGQNSVRSLNDMKQVIANLPQFQEMKTKFSAHMTIASDCMTEFTKQNLETIGLIEQNMACGETPEGSVPKHLVDELVPILDDPYTSQMIKTRLIMLWIATSDKVDTEELQLLLAHARLDQEYKDAIENLSLLGVQLSKSANKQGEKTKKDKKKRESVASQQDVPFDLSRYVPVVKRVVEGHVKETIDQSLFPLLRVAEPESLRRDSTHTRKQAAPKPPSGPPIIIFIAGGMTYSEMRSAYELSETFDREVYIGSTHLITPDKFVNNLSTLDKRPPPPKSVVPPYTTNIHTAAPPRTTSSSETPVPSNSSRVSGHKLLGKW
ncbi:vacuolar sorting protein VPS33/slp1 [Apophysomyces sp. BC1034]|nr:vacuolar sorting protein VPS33/slp1 [Apophysomyces sp. BC1034]